MGKFGTLPWAPERSKKIDLNGNELAITSLSDINNKKCMSKKFFSMIFESCRHLLLNDGVNKSFVFSTTIFLSFWKNNLIQLCLGVVPVT
jgi:hypothetical protein